MTPLPPDPVDLIVGKFFAFKAPDPPILYHYTGWEGFAGILESRAVRVVYFGDMGSKDAEEMQHAWAIINRVLTAVSKVHPAVVQEAGRLLHEKAPVKRGMPLGLACFTTEGSGKRHWEEHGLCNARPAFRFGLRLLPSESLDLPGIGLHLAKVEYDASLLERRLTRSVLDVCGLGSSVAQSGNAVARLCTCVAMTHKSHRDFEWEAEYRLLAMVPYDPSPWKTLNGRRFIEVPLRPRRQALDVTDVLVKGDDSDVARAQELMRRLGYSTSSRVTRAPRDAEVQG